MATLFRLQKENGIGCYDSGTAHMASRFATCCWKHNPPDIDFPDLFSMETRREGEHCKDWFFGFKNLEDLYCWFDTAESIAFLELNGIEIATYEVPNKHYQESKVQVIFRKEFAVQTGTVPFSYEGLAEKKTVRDEGRMLKNFQKAKDFLALKTT